MKINHNRNALIGSMIALLLCVSMLIGTTFAWFTDTVQSDINTIAAGNLDIELTHQDKNSSGVVDSATKLFDDVALWEPGAMVYEKLTVKNNGSLALKYALSININDITALSNGNSLKDVLKVAVMDVEPTRENIKTEATQDLASFRLDGTLLANGSTNTYYIAIYWAPAASDNDYNVAGEALKATLGVSLVATQMTNEEDSIDDQYDKDAAYPAVDIISGDKAVTLGVEVAPSANKKNTQVTVPAGAFPTNTQVGIEVDAENSLFNVSAEGNVVGSLDVIMTVNGVQHEEELTGGKTYTVTTYISTGLSNVTVAYTGTDGRAQPTNVQYDPATGKLTFETTHFSEYAVSGKAIAYDTASDTAFTTTDAVVEALQSTEAKVEIVEDVQTNVMLDLAGKVQDAIDKGLIEEDAPVLEGVQDALENVLAYVGTADALAEALAAGKSIVLTADITVTETIVISADTVMDLGGYTISGTIDTLLKINGGNVILKNGTISNAHAAATETKYSVYMSGNAVAEIKGVTIETSGVGIFMTGNAKITELNANVDSFMTANGYCCFDAISLLDNARIDAITGGEYVTRITEAYIQSWFEDSSHKYSGIESWPVNINSTNASIGTISGGTFLGVMDKANNGTAIHVNAGKVELISGGYFGFVKTGLANPYKLLFVGASGQIGKITGGTFENGSGGFDRGFDQNFKTIVTNSGCKVELTGEKVDVNIQFSTKVTTYTLDVVQVIPA